MQAGDLASLLLLNIIDLDLGLETVQNLIPVKFDWKNNEEHDYGLIAEEVAGLVPDLAIYGNEGEVESVKYQSFNAILAKAIQDLKAEKDAEIEALKHQNKELEARLEALENR